MTLAAAQLPVLQDGDFRRVQALISHHTGIHLTDAKRTLVVARLGRRLRELGLTSFGDYLERVSRRADELTLFIDTICTNDTRFFRDEKQLQFLVEALLPSLAERAQAERRPLRLWSAACSTGEEPFSIAMALSAALGHPPRVEFEVLGTDVSSRVLQQARSARWRVSKADEIPTPHLKAFMWKGVGENEGTMTVDPMLRARVRFEPINLVSPPYRHAVPFDVALCRNVIIYFDAPTRERVLEAVAATVRPGGYVFLGFAEAGWRPMRALVHVGPAVFQRVERAA